MTFSPYTIKYHKDGSRTVTREVEQESVRGECVHLGEKAGILDCECSSTIPYFYCLHPEIEFAIRRKENRRPATPKTTSCLSCDQYTPRQQG